MTRLALEKRDLQPVARTNLVGECDLALGDAARIQYTAGSRPPEPLALMLRIP